MESLELFTQYYLLEELTLRIKMKRIQGSGKYSSTHTFERRISVAKKKVKHLNKRLFTTEKYGFFIQPLYGKLSSFKGL